MVKNYTYICAQINLNPTNQVRALKGTPVLQTIFALAAWLLANVECSWGYLCWEVFYLQCSSRLVLVTYLICVNAFSLLHEVWISVWLTNDDLCGIKLIHHQLT